MPRDINIGDSTIQKSPNDVYRYNIFIDVFYENEFGETDRKTITDEVVSENGSARSEFTKGYFLELLEDREVIPENVERFEEVRVTQETDIIREG